jgi:hypothetical protein
MSSFALTRGTRDLISYKITDLDLLKLDESVSGTGDLCGSVFLDDRFEQYIRRLLGDDVVDAMKVCASKHPLLNSAGPNLGYNIAAKQKRDDADLRGES